MKHRILQFLLIALPALYFANAHAEKADSEKQIVVVSDKHDTDEVKQVHVFTGNVILTQGTLVMKGTKLVLTESPDGWQFATLYAPPGGLATMRQKRDGGPDLWMEGEAAEKITYDQKISIAKLFSNAKVRRLTGSKTTDEAKAAFLSYNSQTETETGANSESGDSVPGNGRPIVIIQPHNHDSKDSSK